MFSRFSKCVRTARSGVKILLFLAVCVPLELVTISFLRLFHWQGGSEGFLKIWPMVGVLYGVTWIFQKMECPNMSVPWWPRIQRLLGFFCFGLALGALLVLLTALCTLAVGGFHWQISMAGVYVSIIKAFPIWLALAMVEEGVFRGFVFQKLIEGIGLRWALFLCALLFAMAHWHNRGMGDLTIKAISTLNLFLLALIFGLTMFRTGTLAFPIGLHLAWNWVQGSFLGFKVSGIPVTGYLEAVLHKKPVWIHGGAFGLEASICAVAVLVLFLASFPEKQESKFSLRSKI